MGTNYYVACNLCECCNRYDEEYHIGKSSYGWAFNFRGYQEDRLVSWSAWKEFLRDKVIKNEYGESIDYDWFVNYIENYKSTTYVITCGQKNLDHNEELKKLDPRQFGFSTIRPEQDWTDRDGYSFTPGEFS